jgi:hypothetical protein
MEEIQSGLADQQQVTTGIKGSVRDWVVDLG